MFLQIMFENNKIKYITPYHTNSYYKYPSILIFQEKNVNLISEMSVDFLHSRQLCKPLHHPDTSTRTG